MKASYRAGAYTGAYVMSGGTNVLEVYASSSNQGNPSNPSQVIPVFKGNRLFATQSTVGYGEAKYIPYLYA